jgi:hypothetical protein
MNILLSPPFAFLIYIPLVLLIVWFGSVLSSGPNHRSGMRESDLYSSGEVGPTTQAAPGYRPFFLIAFFFAILHLAMLVLGSSPLNLTAAVYLVGVILALVALILG